MEQQDAVIAAFQARAIRLAAIVNPLEKILACKNLIKDTQDKQDEISRKIRCAKEVGDAEGWTIVISTALVGAFVADKVMDAKVGKISKKFCAYGERLKAVESHAEKIEEETIKSRPADVAAAAGFDRDDFPSYARTQVIENCLEQASRDDALIFAQQFKKYINADEYLKSVFANAILRTLPDAPAAFQEPVQKKARLTF